MFSNLLGRHKNKNSNKYSWESLNSHKTWRIRNHPININNEYIVLSTDFNVGENGMVIYNIRNDKFEIIQYPQGVTPEYHSYCKHKNDIYIINTDGAIIKFNLNSKTFKHIENIKNKPLIGRYSSCINIKGSDIIHIFGGLQNQYHLMYSITNNQYIIKTNFGVKLENPSVIYLKSKKQLLMFSGYATKSFFIGSINKNNEIEWKVSKQLNVPNKLRDCGQILYKQHIIMFGGCGTNKEYSNNIYLINLQNQNNDNYGKITKLENIHCPTKDKYHVILINDKIHLFGLWNNIKHHSLSINAFNDILPQNNDDIINNDNDDDDKKEEEKIQDIDNNDDNEVINNLRKQIEMKDKKILKLERENKELRLKLLEYERNKNKLDESQYKEWNANMITLWILKIENGIFDEYGSILLEHLIDDGIEGNDLEDINNHDQWKKYGINKYGLRKTLIQNIANLIQYDHDNEGKGNNTQYIHR